MAARWDRRPKRCADRHPLALAARQHPGPSLQQRADSKQIHDLVEITAPPPVAGEPAAVEQVTAHGQMREQPGVLEDIADAPPMAGHVDPLRGVEQRLAIEDDPTARRAEQAGDRVDHRGLAGPRPAEQRRDAGVGGEADVEIERAEPAGEIDLEHQMPRTIRATGRASSSDASIAANARPIETSVSRKAPDSPPGTWVKV